MSTTYYRLREFITNKLVPQQLLYCTNVIYLNFIKINIITSQQTANVIWFKSNAIMC